MLLLPQPKLPRKKVPKTAQEIQQEYVEGYSLTPFLKRWQQRLLASAAIAGSGALFATGLNPASLAPMLALGSALGCVGGISCLSSQQTARLGISVEMSGIATGLAYMNPSDLATDGQLMMLGGAGGGIGYYLSTKIFRKLDHNYSNQVFFFQTKVNKCESIPVLFLESKKVHQLKQYSTRQIRQSGNCTAQL